MAYTHLALIHLSATMPSSVGINTAAIPSELYTAPIAAPSNFSVTNMYEPSVVSQLPQRQNCRNDSILSCSLRFM